MPDTIGQAYTRWLERDASLPHPSNQFRKDLVAYAISTFPNSLGIPDHLRQAYITGDPQELPLFGSSRSALSIYFHPARLREYLKQKEKEEEEKVKEEEAVIEKALDKCRRLCEVHRYSLTREKRRLTNSDPYGNLTTRDWDEGAQGISYFINKVLKAAFSDDEWRRILAAYGDRKDRITFHEQLALLINTAIDSPTSIEQFSHDMSGVEYEDLCERLLLRSGWQVIRTPATGDQGVDLVAIKDNLRVCIQCKLYSRPVGNSAVQEVAAGRLHWQGTHAAVVSSSGYTPGAEQLASSTLVRLLHHQDLSNLRNLL